MNKLTFAKYQGTGNDFIILENLRSLQLSVIRKLCDRKYGIGADGLILMWKEDSFDFNMMYYNADGSESFCGNGSRCAVIHAKKLGWIGQHCRFHSNDGEHEATIEGDIVRLKMHDVSETSRHNGDYIIHTGSPHYLLFEQDLEQLDIVPKAHTIRYLEPYKAAGINVNFLKNKQDQLHIRTYERGVEDETLSCGTGVTAAAIAQYLHSANKEKHVDQRVITKGGELRVSFDTDEEGFKNIYLSGPAVMVFSGEVYVDA